MSADNWRVCARCLGEARNRESLQRLQAKESYGKVSMEEFERLRSEAPPEGEPDIEITFREDFEIGVDGEGFFFVDYAGVCTTCGYGHEFHHREHVKVKP